jgi:hypothetical protein
VLSASTAARLTSSPALRTFGIARQVEGLGLVICLNAIPAGWPAALILACMMPRKESR